MQLSKYNLFRLVAVVVMIVVTVAVAMLFLTIAVAMLFLPATASEVLHGSMVPIPIAAFVSIRQVSAISVTNVVAIIYMPTKMVSMVKPWARADERAIRKPLRPVVAIGSAGIRRVVIVPVWARRFSSKLNTEADLCRRFLRC